MHSSSQRCCQSVQRSTAGSPLPSSKVRFMPDLVHAQLQMRQTARQHVAGDGMGRGRWSTSSHLHLNAAGRRVEAAPVAVPSRKQLSQFSIPCWLALVHQRLFNAGRLDRSETKLLDNCLATGFQLGAWVGGPLPPLQAGAMSPAIGAVPRRPTMPTWGVAILVRQII